MAKNFTADWQQFLPWLQEGAGNRWLADGDARDDIERLRLIYEDNDLAFCQGATNGNGQYAMVMASHQRWEESVIGKPFARVSFLAADNFELALEVARWAVVQATKMGIVLLSASPAESPSYVHVALQQAGFHLGSHFVEMQAPVSRVWPTLVKVPLVGTYRLAGESDVDELVKLGDGANPHARFVSDPFFPSSWGKKLYAAWIANSLLRETVIVGEVSDNIVGFSAVTRNGPASSHFGLLAIQRRFQGLGFGAMLMRKAVEWCRVNHVETIDLKTEQYNIPARQLYDGLGFRLVKTGLTYHWVPATVCELAANQNRETACATRC